MEREAKEIKDLLTNYEKEKIINLRRKMNDADSISEIKKYRNQINAIVDSAIARYKKNKK